MTTQLRALQTFFGPEGDFEKGEAFAIDDAVRAKSLIDGGYAEKITAAEAKAAAAAQVPVDSASPGAGA